MQLHYKVYVTSGATSNQNIVLDGANLVFEGYLENAYETTLTVAEPTADRTVTLPNATGTLWHLTVTLLAYSIVFGG